MQVPIAWKQIHALTTAQITARYRKTVAGFIWVILSPLVMYAAQAWIFKHILRINIPDYAQFLLSGLLPWLFTVSTLEMGIPILKNSREMLIGFQISPSWLVLSVALDNGINFLAGFLILLIPMCVLDPRSLAGLWSVPLSLAVLATGATALTAWLAVLNVLYRDIRFVVHFLTGVLFFLTPIFYPKEFIPEPWRAFVWLNPLYCLLEPVRIGIYKFSLDAWLPSFGRAVVVGGLLVSLAVLSWRKRKNAFYQFL